ncbi:MAG: 50S ribosomal protein L28 [Abditibacteriales bacterium]|nr:50S ribosomal protein L28 [Abditibacteriales bacterium]MDW8368120.1 50S ribosomal protein L28 [Abditibacteriales bacterium]
MAQRCTICGKGVQTGMLVSHSHRRTKARNLPNLQTVKANFNGTVRRVRVCTSCLKAGKVRRAA